MSTPAPVPVWDLPTRIFHWSLVTLIALQYASGEFGWLDTEWHMRFGYAVLALVVWRLLWGLFGSETSRFSRFVRGPATTLAYARQLLAGRAAHEPGHNPLGAWSVLAMLASLLVQSVSGLFTSDDIFYDGPLVAKAGSAMVDWMGRVHELNRWVLLALIAAHILAVILHSLLTRHNLVTAMVHGKAPAAMAPRLAHPLRALVLLAVSAALVWALVAWGRA